MRNPEATTVDDGPFDFQMRVGGLFEEISTADVQKEVPRKEDLLVLRYFLGGGRLAELRIPGDANSQELRRLFKHLQIDLLDSGESEPPHEAS